MASFGSGLEGRVAIVTGASSGIGEALSILLAQHGCRVVICARRTDRLQNVANRIAGDGGTCLAVHADVTRPDHAGRLVQQAIDEFGRIDILVNNAGRGHFGSVEDTEDAIIQSIFAVNVYSLWYVSRPVLRQMKKQGKGHIINVSSMAGKVGYPYNSAYVAAKHACVGFTHALRQELVETGITASVVCPAGVLTDWAASTEGASMLSFFKDSGPAIKRIAAARGLELPRIEGVKSAEEIARLILECIYHPVAEVYTHAGSREFALLAARDREASEQLQIPIILGEREVYEKLKPKGKR